MLGAIAGDIIGSVHEHVGTKSAKAISLGGDADTLACIAGGIAEAYYGGVPPAIATRALLLLDDRLCDITLEFCERYEIKTP